MHLRILLVAPLTVALLACGEEPQTRCGEPRPDALTFLGVTGTYAHPHDRWLELNEEIPSFAGYYLEGVIPHMLLTIGAPREDIAKAREWAGGGVVLTTANFTFRELREHWNAGRDVAFTSVPDGHFYAYDLDEKDNVVRADVATQEDVDLATEAWAAAGLPPLAFAASIGSPSCFLAD